MIDPRLRVLQVVAHRGTVTAAAESLSYSPSAVSHQLRQLADDLGVPLLEPSGRGVRLTEQARIVLRHAEILFAQAERAYADLAADTTSGTFTLCGFSTAAANLLPAAAAAVRGAFPQLGIRVIESEPARCLDLLLTGEADLALVAATADLPATTDHRFDQRHLFDDPLDLVVPTDHPLAGRRKTALADAAGEPWIVSRPDSPYHPLMVSACLTAGFAPNVAHYADEWDTGLALVSAGLGITLIPRTTRIHSDWAVVRVPLRGRAKPVRSVSSLTRMGARERATVATALAAIEEEIRRMTSTATAPPNT
ncbi:MAG: LysR family transcriptional regulator [Gordonia sp. (in: high G+C Gram-positive bacteria)]|uniref:LysR family transcriptional regulator n=1 Tax=Gordonia sp. (in: high G+C Gram-positive bacteria) TaxID=84139 RepID=UPI0039E3943C